MPNHIAYLLSVQMLQMLINLSGQGEIILKKLKNKLQMYAGQIYISSQIHETYPGLTCSYFKGVMGKFVIENEDASDTKD